MAHRFSKEDGWTKVKRKRTFRGPVHCTLDIEPRKLEKADLLVIESSDEVATYSTMLRSACPRPAMNVCLAEELRKFVVMEPYRRTLCADDNANLQYVRNLSFPFNLNIGFGTQIAKRDENEFLSLLLESLVHKDIVGQTDFVCFRNLLTNISCTPCDLLASTDCGMIVVVQKLGDVFYMFEFPTGESLAKKAALSEREKEMMYWGMKFESFVTGQCTSDPLNYNAEFCSVRQIMFGSHSIALRAEIDCCGGDGRYIELKTSKITHQDKLLKWWLQSYLGGVEKLMCGMRDNKGIVDSVKRFKVDEIAEQIHLHKRAACLAFLNSFLGFVKENVEAEFIPHVFKRHSHAPKFEMFMDDEGKYKFIPGWFVGIATKKYKHNY